MLNAWWVAFHLPSAEADMVVFGEDSPIWVAPRSVFSGCSNKERSLNVSSGVSRVSPGFGLDFWARFHQDRSSKPSRERMPPSTARALPRVPGWKGCRSRKGPERGRRRKTAGWFHRALRYGGLAKKPFPEMARSTDLLRELGGQPRASLGLAALRPESHLPAFEGAARGLFPGRSAGLAGAPVP